jgi:hypothetical protein
MANRTFADKPYISTPMMLSTEPERVRDSPKGLLDGLLIHQLRLPVLSPASENLTTERILPPGEGAKMGCTCDPPKFHIPAGPANRLVSAERWYPLVAVTHDLGQANRLTYLFLGG